VAGFTLIELIIVMVITGILAAMVALFIRSPVQAYVDSVARAEITDIADLTLRRLTRDLRLALPNSVRITTVGTETYLELLLTKTGGRYLAEEDGQGLAGVLSFSSANPSPNPLQFTIVGTPPAGRQAIVAGDRIAVYNLGPGFDPADAYNCGGSIVSCNLATVAGIAGNTVTLQSNPFQSQSPPMPSPSNRFQVVSTPVTYYCDPLVAGMPNHTGRLMRYTGYTISASQPADTTALPLSAASSQTRLADNISACNFAMATLVNIQRGLVSLQITLTSGTESVNLMQQVHVDNAP
jgi:MSHA biogenesis protein MshO